MNGGRLNFTDSLTRLQPASKRAGYGLGRAFLYAGVVIACLVLFALAAFWPAAVVWYILGVCGAGFLTTAALGGYR